MKDTNQANIAIIALNRLMGFSRRKAHKIQQIFDGLENPSFNEIIRKAISMGIFQKGQPVGQFLDAEDYATNVIKTCEENDVKIINAFSPDFPDALKFENHPLIFFYRGNIHALNNEKRITVVGTRFPNMEGKEFAYNVAEVAGKNGYTVISGLSIGCDTFAHQAALDIQSPTVAFVPGSVDRIAPMSCKIIADEIVKSNGLVISEYTPLSTTNAAMFIARDRLQAGAAQMVFVSEFADQSGTLQTLEFAHKFNKPIYTLDTIAQDPEFNGYKSLYTTNINCIALTWDEIVQLLQG